MSRRKEDAKPKEGKILKLGPSCRWITLYRADGRTYEGMIVRRVRSALSEHVGGNPSVAQSLLIERAAWLSLRLALKERKLLETGDLTRHDDLHYMSWTNGLVKILDRLGISCAPA